LIAIRRLFQPCGRGRRIKPLRMNWAYRGSGSGKLSRRSWATGRRQQDGRLAPPEIRITAHRPFNQHFGAIERREMILAVAAPTPR
jgi:hypothetical protein